MQHIIGKMEKKVTTSKKRILIHFIIFLECICLSLREKKFYEQNDIFFQLALSCYMLEVREVCSLVKSAFLCLVRISLYFRECLCCRHRRCVILTSLSV